MPEINFYILKQMEEADALFFVCRLTETAFKQGRKIYIHVESEQAARTLDDFLWNFKAESFLPHSILSTEVLNTKNNEDGEIGEDKKNDPILIAWEDNNASTHQDVLINLAAKIPAFHAEFQRIAEIVRNDEQCKQLSREHWTLYKNLGYQLKKTEI